ncbi:hypothetical protein H4R20_000220 [Coemansia guatemalensis]|uniref:Lytic polysaccharide monooxygenase n=1 Tax=Coemansia guatemalensis TaxID=2761395 RepID=A0A9W8LWU8_9FUNG|nr:hypothetical protein H4R20_000220 [Coemansia guatemalensis]
MTTINALALLMMLGLCWAQVEMREPPPRRSKFSKNYIAADDVDYNMKSALGGKIGYPCRNTTAGAVQGTLVAGQDLKVFFDGTATRQGGDCQFAISYDNGTNFAVVWDKLGNCLLDTVNGGYEVPIPDRLPAAKEAVFAWTWIPSGGSRSYYMNCADVRIENYGKQEAYTGKELLAVNVPGKPSLAPVRMQSNDTLPSLLDSRPLITVGEPARSTAADDGAVAEADAEADPDSTSNDDNAEDNADGNGEGGTVVMYVSESTTTTTNVVVVSQFITEDDTDVNALYTFGNGIQTRGQLSTTLGPYVKPLFGSNVGLTIAPASTEAADADATGLVFTGDWAATASPRGSAKWLGSESVDFIPPSLSPLHSSSSSSSSLDLWPSATQSTDVPYPAGTPLFATHHAQSVPTSASANSAPAAHATTKLNTVTKDGKPMLQVVVSMDSSALPESLTLSY